MQVPVMGLVRGERFFAGKPLSYWADEFHNGAPDETLGRFRGGGTAATAVVVDLLNRPGAKVRQLISALPDGPEGVAAAPALCALLGKGGESKTRVEILAIRWLAFSPAGDQLWACGGHGLACFDVASGKPLADVVGRLKANGLASAEEYRGMELSGDGSTLALVGGDSSVSIWDLPSCKLRCRTTRGEALGLDNEFLAPLSRDGRRMAGRVAPGSRSAAGTWPADEEGGIEVVDTQTGAAVAALEGPAWPLNDVAFSPDGRWVVGCGDGRVDVWDARSGARIAAWGPGTHLAEYARAIQVDPSNQELFLSIAFTTGPAGRPLLVALSNGPDLRVWEMPAGTGGGGDGPASPKH